MFPLKSNQVPGGTEAQDWASMLLRISALIETSMAFKANSMEV